MLCQASSKSPDHESQMPLTGIDGVWDRKVVDNFGLPVLPGATLASQAVVEAGQAWAFKGGHSQDVCEEDGTTCCSEAS